MSDVLQLIDQQERALDALYASHKGLLKLARTQQKELEARSADDDEWTRMPSKGQRCKISNWSRSKLNHLHATGKIRKKRSAGSTFYAGLDVRRLIQGE